MDWFKYILQLLASLSTAGAVPPPKGEPQWLRTLLAVITALALLATEILKHVYSS